MKKNWSVFLLALVVAIICYGRWGKHVGLMKDPAAQVDTNFSASGDAGIAETDGVVANAPADIQATNGPVLVREPHATFKMMATSTNRPKPVSESEVLARTNKSMR